MEDIFSQLDELILKSKSINESKHDDDEYDIDPEYSTSEQGIKAAAEQIAKRIFGKDDSGGTPPPPGGGGKTEMEEDDDPLKEPKSKKGKDGDGVDKTFKSKKMKGLDDLEDIGDEDETDDGEKDDSLPEDEDFEFDDFDYDDKDPSTGGDDGDSGDGTPGGETSDDDYDYEDGDFEDGEMGDEEDYDFGDDDSGDGDYDGDDGDGDPSDGKDGGEDGGKSGKIGGKSGIDDMISEPGGGSPKSKKDSGMGKKGMDIEGGGSDPGESKGGDGKEGSDGSGGKSKPGVSGKSDPSGKKSSDPGSSGDSDSSSKDIDYDDTLDYDSPDDDSLEGEIKDALDRIKEGSDNEAEKKSIEDLEKSFEEEDGKSMEEKADELKEKINDATDDTKASVEVAGESLDKVPDDKDFEEDMKKAGFDEEDIDRMKRDKDVDPMSEEEEEKITEDAMEELDKKAKKEGRDGSSLSKTIMSAIVGKTEITNMEWREIVKIFLDSRSKKLGRFGKTKVNAYPDRKHLWRDASMPTKRISSGGVHNIYCFLDFSGSVEQTLVFSFLRRVLLICDKTHFDSISVYGFAQELSKPYQLKKRDLKKSAEDIEKQLKEMWNFIDDQNLDGSIENFKVVAEEINNIKRKDKDAPFMIFGDGLWSTLSYYNPQPPIRLKEICPRYLDDILALVYYSEYMKDHVEKEVGYLKKVVGLKHVVSTEVEELEKGD